MQPITWQRVLAEMPLIAILRGVKPDEVVEIAEALSVAGFLCVEVPLNSPDPLASITRLRDRCAGRLFIGAGTVLTTIAVKSAYDAGAQFIVSPNANPEVIRATKACGLVSLPGIVTATEAFSALEAGADALKLFPGEAAPPPVLRALKTVLPANVSIFPVGGITPDAIAPFVDAGAAGFGIGSAVYKQGLGHGDR